MTRILTAALAAFGLATVLGPGATPAAAQSADYRWDMPNAFSSTSSDGVADRLFKDLVEQKTDGRIAITNHFDASLGYKALDHLDAVRDGAVPVARQAMVYLGGYDPLFLLSTLPFLMQDKEEVDALYEIVKPHYEALFLEHNQVLVSIGLFPPSGMWSREPIRSEEELDGFKLRVYDLNGLETFKRAGAAAVNIGWSDVLPALSTGAIDGVLTSADLGISSNIQEFLPVFTEINWAIPFSAVTINKQEWDALPDDLKQAVMEAGEETTRRTFERLPTQVQQNYEEMRAKDVQIITEVPEPFFDHLWASAQPTIENWREKSGAEGNEILDAYLERVGR
jgi:TRAP-type C4-dicarboxylate transport system substrate-binding protein